MSCKPCEEKAAAERAELERQFAEKLAFEKAEMEKAGKEAADKHLNSTINLTTEGITSGIAAWSPPEYAGGYDITGQYKKDSANYTIVFNFYNKPSTIHRFFAKLLLGWIWIDYKKKK